MTGAATSRARGLDRGTLALFAFSFALAGLLLLHVLRTDYPVRSHMISDYAVGPHGWIMVLVFVAMSLGYAMLALGFLELGPQVWAARVGSILLGIVSVGLIVSAVFPTDLPGATFTRSGEIHERSFLVNVGGSVLAVLLLTLSFRREATWLPFRRAAVVLAGAVALALLIQFLTLRRGAPYGIANRVFVVALCGWFVGAAVWLRRVRDLVRPPAPATSARRGRAG